jgi:MFS family permease
VRLDGPGLALVTGGVLGLVWALVRGNAAGWGSVEVVTSAVAGAALVVGFVWWEARAPAPMLPLGLFRARAFSAGNAAIFFMTASLFGAVFFMAQFLQVAQGDGPLEAGLRLLPWTATLFVVAPIAGARIERVGERPFVVLGLLLQAAGMAWIALVASPGVAYGALVAPLVVAGTGASMTIPAAQSAVVGAVPRSQLGRASATFSALRQLGGAFGVAILVAVFASAGDPGSPGAFADGLRPALAVSAGLSLLGALAGVALPRRAGSAYRAAAVGAATSASHASAGTSS